MEKKVVFALICLVVISALSAGVSYLCFKVLESTAEGSWEGWTVGGAIAGFGFTAALCTSVALQFYDRMTKDEVSKYRDQVQELQAKLIKGASCPPGYSIDLDEKHKVVFARPDNWMRAGSVLYAFQNRHNKATDPFPANFCLFYRGEEEISRIYKEMGLGKFNPANVDHMYHNMVTHEVKEVERLPSYQKETLTEEYVNVDAMKGMKFTHVYSIPEKSGKTLKLHQSGVFVYVARLEALFQFIFSDNFEDYTESSEVFSNVVSSVRFL